MRVLVVDIGGTNLKILASGRTEPRKTPSGPGLTPRKMIAAVKDLAPDWEFDAVAIGYPGRVVDGRIMAEPRNLGHGWVGFEKASDPRRPAAAKSTPRRKAAGEALKVASL